MTPERWHQITGIFHAARARQAVERDRFLISACGDDSELRHAVDAMLVADADAVDFGKTPGVRVPLLLAQGAQFGSYRVEQLIGHGGMGDVYRARDTTLDRNVAIKVLPPAFVDDPTRRERFQREARVLAALNHPNIGTIHGIEHIDGVHALILELIEGPTLADRIAHGPIPLDEVIHIAKQIADALEAAHERGVVHRDIKPSNVITARDGMVKVVDFGLATSTAVAASNAGGTDSSAMTATTSGEGLIAGTAPYMSPEQARGQTVDRRTDIFAFGCVLFEMISGRRAFQGDDVEHAIASVLKDEPDWTLIPGEAPPPIRLLLKRCLEKNLHARLTDIGTARFLLTEDPKAFATVGTINHAKRSERTIRRRGVAIFAGVVVGACAATATAVWVMTRPNALTVTRTTITSSGSAAIALNGADRDLAISPDGRRIAYVGGFPGRPRLLIRSLDELESKVLVAEPAQPRGVFFSPDGQWIGFFDGTTTLKKVPVTGGPPVTISRVTNNPRGATWGRDGSIIFANTDPTTGLLRVSAEGGDVSVLTRPDREHGESDHIFPEIIPGLQRVIFTIISADGLLQNARLAVLDLRQGTRKILLSGGFHGRYVSSGHLIYGVAGTLRAVRFNLNRLEVSGTPVSLIPQLVTTTWGAAEFDLADDGTLAYVHGTAGGQLRSVTWVDRQGREDLITALPPRPYLYPRVSPDGTRIALDIRDQENDVWIWDLTRQTLKRLTTDPGLDRTPAWTPDGHVIFSSVRGSPLGNLYRQSADGIGNPERLTDTLDFQAPSAVSPDGKRLIFTETGDTRDVMLLTLDNERRVRPLVRTPFNEQNGAISPDGRWLVYESDESGQFQIYVRPFPHLDSGLWQLSDQGGTQAAWSRDGRELFYVAASGALMSTQVETGTEWKASTPATLIDARYFVGNPTGLFARAYDISPDGKRFLMVRPAVGSDPNGPPPQIVVVQHWVEELKALVPRVH